VLGITGKLVDGAGAVVVGLGRPGKPGMLGNGNDGNGDDVVEDGRVVVDDTGGRVVLGAGAVVGNPGTGGKVGNGATVVLVLDVGGNPGMVPGLHCCSGAAMSSTAAATPMIRPNAIALPACYSHAPNDASMPAL
jgi:hypothetical protein